MGGGPAVAVRSSTNAEDLPDMSFAGQQETYLNVRGTDEVVSAVENCWASLWTTQAISYRHQNGIDQGSVAMAVVVQMIVSATRPEWLETWAGRDSSFESEDSGQHR